MSERSEPHQRLIEATIAQIEDRGLSNVTVRGIAAEADMNVAAVNYYFGSKSALLDAALAGSIEHMMNDSAQLLAAPGEPVDVMTNLLGYYLEGAIRYPQLTKAHLDGAFRDDDYSGIFPTRMAPMIAELCEWLRRKRPDVDEANVEARVVAALSAALFPAAFSGLFAGQATLRTVDARAEYVRWLAANVVA